MDGHFGNYPSAWMVVQTGLHFVSKLRSDAALYEPFTGKYCGRGPHPKYGDKVNVRQMKKKYLKSDKKENGIRTQIYQATLLNKEFAFPINVVDPENQSCYHKPGARHSVQHRFEVVL